MTRSSKHALRAFLTVALVCCTSWGRPAPADRALLDKGPSRVRVTLADGRQFEVEHPRVRGDTLFGDSLALRGIDRMVSFPVAIPFAGVRSLSTRRFSVARTMVLVMAVPMVAGIIAVLTSDNAGHSYGGGGGYTCAGPGGM